jgi:uncharacterized membrane protein YesL
MTGLLATDGLVYRVLNGWFTLVRASLVWLLLCLPVVTAPAATVVLLHTAGRLLNGRAAPGLAESWRLVRERLWPSLRLAGLVLAGDAVVLSAVLGPSPSALLPFVVVPVAITWVLACQWPFALAEERSYGAWAALRLSYLRAVRRPDLAAVTALGTVALVAVGLLLPTTVWLPYWLVVPAVWALLVSTTSHRAARRSFG